MPNLPLILLGFACLIVVISQIWLIVLAFQRSVIWGLVTLFVPFFGSVAFLVVGWDEAKRPFFWVLTAALLFCVGIYMLPQEALVPGNGAAATAGNNALNALRGARTTVLGKVDVAEPSAPEVPAEKVAPAVTFQSKLPPPTVPEGQRDPAKPGFYYLTERVRTTTDTGVKAAHPGEEVRLYERLPGKRLRVMAGDAKIEVSESQVTDDLNIARQKEKEDFVAHGGKL